MLQAAARLCCAKSNFHAGRLSGVASCAKAKTLRLEKAEQQIAASASLQVSADGSDETPRTFNIGVEAASKALVAKNSGREKRVQPQTGLKKPEAFHGLYLDDVIVHEALPQLGARNTQSRQVSMTSKL